MGRSRYKIFETHFPYFLSSSVVHWLPLFSNSKIAQIVFDSLNFLQQEKRIVLYAYVLMENHFHIIASSSQLATEIARFKSFTARKIIDLLYHTNARDILKQLEYYKLKHKSDRRHQLWQEGTHPKMIENEQMMLQKIDYIHQNPVRRGYVEESVHWRYSSARNYSGLDSLVNVTFFNY